MKQLYLLLAVLLLPAITKAHQGSARGTLTDARTQRPVSGAAVTIDSFAYSTLTDAFGKFFLRGVRPGTHTLAIRYLGYETIRREVTIEDGETAELQLAMQPQAMQMEGISVLGGKDLKLTAINLADAKLRPTNNTQDLLRLVPGLFIAQHQGGGKAEQIFIRGFDCDHGTDINLSVDGMPVNMVSHAHGQGFADAHFIIPETIQRLDYGKGPYDADKGNFYTAGYVAFSTRDKLASDFATVEGGMYNYLRAATGYNLLKAENGRKADAYVVAEGVYNRGYFIAPQDFNRLSVAGKYTHYLAADKKLSVTAMAFHSGWDASGQIPERAVAQGIVDEFGTLDPEAGSTGRYNLNLEYLQRTGDNSYFKTNAYATRYNFLLYSNFTFFAADPINGDQIRQAEDRMLYGYNAEYGRTRLKGDIKWQTKAGVGARYDDIRNSELSHTQGMSRLLERIMYGDTRELNLSGYASEKATIAQRLTISAALRYDYLVQHYTDKVNAEQEPVGGDAGKLLPKAGISYQAGGNTRIYYNFGTGYHANDARTIYSGRQLGGAITLNNTLPKATAHDLGVEYTYGSVIAVGTALWLMDLEQEFGYSGDAAVADESGRSRRMGIDASVRWQMTKRLFLYADANLARSRFLDQPKGEDLVALAAVFTSTGGVRYQLTRKLQAGLHYRHMGDRPASDDGSLTAPGYTVLDAGINYVHRRFEYDLQIQNLLNTRWREAQFATETRLRTEVMAGLPAREDICYTPGTPFFGKVSVTYRF